MTNKKVKKTQSTYIRSINIKHFRGLRNLIIPIGKRITLLCGKNGTSKSSILGIAAQVFSFEKDYEKNTELSYKTITGGNFESVVSEHFRLSAKFDMADSMQTTVSIHDGYTSRDGELTLKLYESKDRIKPRPIVRGNTLSDGNSSRNATHPVIYLSLKRLTPISQRARYTEDNNVYIAENRRDFVALSNRLLSKRSAVAVTATKGSIRSASAHGPNYDHDSVSAGEDNAGQILLAIFSFRKLKEEYPDYKGGLLLIDEADAGLFPAAQRQLIKILTEECDDLNLQVIMTSHSPTMIEDIHNLSTLDARNYQNIYLTDSYGPIKIFENVTWPQIFADLHVQPVLVDTNLLPQINMYFEDKEAYDFYAAIITDRTLNKVTNLLKDVALGCSEYIKLVIRKIPEFTSRSLIILDGDVESVEGFSSIIKLPGALPPDQLIFEFLYNLDPADPYWKNASGFTKPVFLSLCEKISDVLEIDPADDQIDLAELIATFRETSGSEDQRVRSHFKNFAKDKRFVSMVSGGAAKNPYRAWVKHNPELAAAFREDVRKGLRSTLINGHGIESAMLKVLDAPDDQKKLVPKVPG